MPSNSEIILSANTHPSDSTTQTITGDKFKGDGYYGRSDGLHTIQVNLSGFLGNIEVKGTIEKNPTDADYFPILLGTGQKVDTSGKVSTNKVTKLEYNAKETSSKTYNFTGNYVWKRAKISNWTDGTGNRIIINH
jgi:hypothetical protein